MTVEAAFLLYTMTLDGIPIELTSVTSALVAVQLRKDPSVLLVESGVLLAVHVRHDYVYLYSAIIEIFLVSSNGFRSYDNPALPFHSVLFALIFVKQSVLKIEGHTKDATIVIYNMSYVCLC